jgi:hypothetical protein
VTKEYGIKFRIKKDRRVETLWCADERHQNMKYNAFRANPTYLDVTKVERKLVDRTSKKKKKK